MIAKNLKITIGLMVLGALGGVVCGALTLVPLAIKQAFWPSHGDWLVGSAREWLPAALQVGGVFGAILGPVLGWGLLRNAPLWRAALWSTAGATLGSAMGYVILLGQVFPETLGETSFFWGGAAGASIAAALLRARIRRQRAAYNDDPFDQLHP